MNTHPGDGAAAHTSSADREPLRRRPPTSGDVARRARVSRSTVSFVLNNVPDSRISDDTRERVLAAAEELGYIPHALASALAAGQNQLVLIPFFNLPHSQNLNVFYDHLAGRLTELGYTVMFHRDQVASGPALVRQWASLRPVGVIIEAQRLDDQAVEVLRNAGTRAILPLGGPTADAERPGWAWDMGMCAAEHLIATGHRKLGVVVPRDPALVEVALGRLHGVEQIAQAAGAVVERIDLALDERDAFVLAQRWRRTPHPSGVFAYNDEYAMLLMRALLDNGIAIPGDVAVIGCDNAWFCEFLRPRLTSIAVPVAAQGRALANIVHALILGQAQPLVDPDTLRSNIIIRESG